MKLQVGDKVWLVKSDGARPRGWAVWDGTDIIAACGVRYTVRTLARLIYQSSTNWGYGHPNDYAGLYGYLAIAEQLFGDGTWDWPL